MFGPRLLNFCRLTSLLFFFFNDTATTEIYTLSLHDALPICRTPRSSRCRARRWCPPAPEDRKSTRLNSSHQIISYAVFCLKKKQQQSNKYYIKIKTKYKHYKKKNIIKI